MEAEISKIHAEVVNQLIINENIYKYCIYLIGLQGHTIFHDLSNQKTCQLSIEKSLVKRTFVNVISCFCSNDGFHGVQGVPLALLFHITMIENLIKPLMALYLGGVANIFWIGENVEPTYDSGKVMY